MNAAPDIARIASLLAEPARAKIMWTLIDGTVRPAGELAYAASISPQSASAHLTKLVDGKLLEVEEQGRHRYFRIPSPEVADLVEDIASVAAATATRTPHSPQIARTAPPAFLRARSCYGHLAGQLAVDVLDAMTRHGWLVPDGRDYTLTTVGERNLAELDIDLTALRRRRRLFARACVDLTQRRRHLGGALGDALLDAYLARNWVRRRGTSRIVDITPDGRAAFRRIFGI